MGNDRELAVVTGGALGIGLAIARRLGRDGFSVRIFDVDAEALVGAVAALRAEGLDVEGCRVDVSSEADIVEAFAALPRVDVLVANAAIVTPCPIEDLSLDLYRRTIDVNLIGTFLPMREAARRMKAGGRMVALASRGILGDAHLAHYISSKTGIVGLVRALGFELRPKLINVNAVAPGSVDTGTFRGLPPERRAALVAMEPRGRLATPEDIANAVAFLCSAEALYITGQTLFVDGGKSLGGLTAAI